MDLHRDLKHGWTLPVIDADSFRTPTKEEALNCGKWQNAEEQEDVCSLVGSASICSVKHKREVSEASFGTGQADAWDDNGILSCLDQLCRTFSPLGKSIDYVQSDLTSIAKERAAIVEEIRRQQTELRAEKQKRQQIFEQESRRLEKAKLQLQQEKDEISTLEAQIFSTQARIQLIMGGAINSEEVKRFATQQARKGTE